MTRSMRTLVACLGKNANDDAMAKSDAITFQAFRKIYLYPSSTCSTIDIDGDDEKRLSSPAL
jgi:hypothetical protein